VPISGETVAVELFRLAQPVQPHGEESAFRVEDELAYHLGVAVLLVEDEAA
jgi:hypothetical protein